ncbi:MAG: Hpt domain-containing protein [Oscillospiraceae bacterium]|nr:Hpt domain-containing protein [Oscillospiraceae bacterium]
MNTDDKGLAYLDIADGLARISSNKALYSLLLDKFLADQNWMKLCDSREKDDLGEAANAAHAIKGACANLSMKSLCGAAAELEASLKAGMKDDGLFEAMRASREETIAAVNAYKAQ